RTVGLPGDLRSNTESLPQPGRGRRTGGGRELLGLSGRGIACRAGPGELQLARFTSTFVSRDAPVSVTGSVTHWIGLLKAGQMDAAQKLWECYFSQLVRLARRKLRGRGRAASSGEDVALSAFDSFCRGARQGRFPQLRDRADLWQLLVLLTA